MELYDEVKEERKSKAPAIIGVCIVILVILTIMVFAGILYLKNSITTINIDGARNTEIEEIFYIESTSEGTQVYVPIIKMAEFLDYEGFNGDYKIKSEDKTKCHAIGKNETAMFTLDSDTLVKITEDSENEYIKLDKPVFELNGELYTTIEGVQDAFNVLFLHDEDFKNINIYTMSYLVKYYAAQQKIKEYSTEFVDQKAIFEDMLIIEQNNKYGVINAKTGEAILESKYDYIKYLPTTSEFLVKSNGKYGVVAKDTSIIIKTVYDEIKSMDNQNGLYLVKQNATYGVVDTKGNIIIAPEYRQIGINIDKYAQNGVENKYVLLNEIIPIKNEDGLWAFFNIKGEKVTDFKYTGIGCTSTPVANSYPVLVIPSYKMIVVQINKKYNLVTTEGKEMIEGDILDSVYLKSDLTTGENKFYMTSSNNTKVIDIQEWLTSIGQ